MTKMVPKIVKRASTPNRHLRVMVNLPLPGWIRVKDSEIFSWMNECIEDEFLSSNVIYVSGTYQKYGDLFYYMFEPVW